MIYSQNNTTNGRIAFILDNVFPPDARVQNEAIALIRAQYEVHLFCLDYTGIQKDREEYLGIKIHRYRVPSFYHNISGWAYSFPLYHRLMQPLLARFLSDVNPDFIHIHDIQIAQAVFNINKNKLPVVLDLHENRPEIMKYYDHVQKIPGKWFINPERWKKSEARFIQFSDKIIVVTPEAKKYYVKNLNFNPEKITVLPNTVSENFYKNAPSYDSIAHKFKNNFVILYVGRTGLRRGLAEVINSLPRIKKEIPNIKLVIVGNSKSDPYLMQLAKILNLADNISFEGYQNAELLPSYIRASHIGISPLHRNIHHDTTYANKLFQYLSLAKPVIVSDCTSQKRIVEENNCGLVFKSQDSKDFARQVLALYHDPELRDTFGSNGKRFVREDFNWSTISRPLVELYDQLTLTIS